MKPVVTVEDTKKCGLFGAIRKYDIHTGLDLYCEQGAEVYCIMEGTVVDIFQFTGEIVGSPWWNDTYAVVVESGDLTFVYGELIPEVYVGKRVFIGDLLGSTTAVLKKDKGNTPVCMLHLETWLTQGYIKNYTWNLNQIKPIGLIDPLEILKCG